MKTLAIIGKCETGYYDHQPDYYSATLIGQTDESPEMRFIRIHEGEFKNVDAFIESCAIQYMNFYNVSRSDIVFLVQMDSFFLGQKDHNLVTLINL